MDDVSKKERLEWALSELCQAMPEDLEGALADVPEGIRAGWRLQMRNRPRIHRAIDTCLAHELAERLANMPSLVELTEWLKQQAAEAHSAAEVSQRMPVDERGRVKAAALEDLFCIAGQIIFFLSAEGYPDRREVPRILRAWDEEWERTLKEMQEDEDDGPYSDWNGGTK